MNDYEVMFNQTIWISIFLAGFTPEPLAKSPKFDRKEGVAGQSSIFDTSIDDTSIFDMIFLFDTKHTCWIWENGCLQLLQAVVVRSCIM